MIKAILFDVDGTLIDSNDLHAAAWQQAFRHFGIDLGLEAIREQIGKGGDNLIPSLLPADQAQQESGEIQDFRSELFARDYLPRVQPFPKVRALFEQLHASDIKIVLATSAGREELNFHRGLLACDDLIHAATSKDDVEHSKPCPDIFEAALAKVASAAASEALVIGDTPWDMKAAAKAGMAAIAVRCGGFSDQALGAAGAAALYEGPVELAALFPVWLPA
ncbi:MAG: HAD family hydrolase [Allosphingosinicella sp.]